jgi:SPP1 gp7 family putative phage head morphogenesis protein
MMPDLRERIASFLRPQTVPTTVVPGQEIAYSESLFNTGTTAYKYDPDSLRSRKGVDIYNRMLIDEQVKAVVRFRRDAITGREFFFQFDQDVELSDDEKETRIGLFNTILDDMSGSFVDALNAVMAGVWQGFSITEKVHGIIEYKGTPYVGLEALKKKPYESFRFNVDQYGNVLSLEQDLDGNVRKVPITKVIHYVQNPEFDEHYGGSELREAYRSWFSKDVAIKFWNIFLERSAGGVWIARPKEGAVIINGSTEYNAILDILRNMSSSSAMLVPASIEIEHIAPQSTSEYQSAVEFHDLSIAKSLLVPNLLGISHTGQTGAFSQSQTQFKAFMLVLEADSTRLEAVLNEQLFRELGELNFADGLFPKFKLKPLSVDQVLEMLKIWNDLVGKDTVEPSDTDEAHIRNLLEMPEKGEPLPRRQQPIGQPGQDPFQQPDPNGAPPNGQSPNLIEPDELTAARDQAAWKLTFTKALKRVRFTVIDRESQKQMETSVDKYSTAMMSIISDMVLLIEEQKLGTSQGEVESIDALKFTPKQKRRIKDVSVKMMGAGWKTGERHAQDEIDASREGAFRANMKRLEGRAFDFFEAKGFTIAGGLTADTEAIIRNILMNGLKFSWSTQDVVNAIYKSLVAAGLVQWQDAWSATSMDIADFQESLEGAGLTAHRLETVVRTNYFEALNEARYNYFTDPALGDFVQAMEYSAILDSRTTSICQHLDGRVFNKESDNWEKYRPPNHFNCRSLLIAVTENDTWTESKDPTLDPQSGFGGK